jgi:hypothetical protein
MLRGWIERVDRVIEGWAQDAGHPELPVLLEVLLGDRQLGRTLACGYRGDLEQAGLGRGWCQLSFELNGPLSLTERRQIHVRRQSAAAEIQMTEACRKSLGLKPQEGRLHA